MTTTRTASTTVKKPGRPPRAPKPVEEPTPEVEPASEKILIHFVSDGFTAFGYVWSKGQELEIEKPSPEYDRTCDTTGQSWLELSSEEQSARWGKVVFRHGPSSIPNSILEYRVIPGDGVDLSGRPKYQGYMAKQEREKAANTELERGRNVPVL